MPRPLEALSSVVELAEVEEWHSLSRPAPPSCHWMQPLEHHQASRRYLASMRWVMVGRQSWTVVEGWPKRSGVSSTTTIRHRHLFDLHVALSPSRTRGRAEKWHKDREREREREHYVYLCLIHSSSLCLCLCIGNHAYSSTTTTAQSSDRVILIEENPSNNVVVDHIGTVRANGARSNFPNVFQIGEFPVYFPTPPEGEQLFSTFINDIVDNGLDVGQNAPVVGVVTPSFGPIQVRPLGRQNLINERPKPPKFQVPAIPGVNVPLGSSSSDAAALVAPVAMLVAAVAVLLF